MKTYAAHLADAKATRDAKINEMKAIAQKAMDEQRNMDGGESEKFDTLRAEIKSLEADIKRFSELAALDAETAKPVDDTAAREKTFTLPSVPVQVKSEEKLEPGIGFARAAKCLAIGFMEHRSPVEIARERYGDNSGITKTARALTTKAAVDPATTTNPAWAGVLVGDTNIAGFMEYLRPRTLVGQFGANGVPELRRVPFRAAILAQTARADAQWSGEGKQKIVTKAGWGEVKLEPHKIATIAVATMELVRDSSPSVDTLIRDELARAVIERMDISFMRPDITPETYRPGSILNGITETASTGGTDSDAVREDLRVIMGKYLANRNPLSGAVLLMGSQVAYSLAMMFTIGTQEFPDISISGGKLAGIPVLVSDYVPAGIVALVHAPSILYADDGGVELAMSTEASIRMDTVGDASAQLVSMWQNNMVAFRAEKRVSWKRANDTCVEYLTGVNWGA